ncbi:MAG: hypothetical protein GZ094_21215 [Mariniphaga sp.]|nr:hypothetical protein [Mariniphaga sp.]
MTRNILNKKLLLFLCCFFLVVSISAQNFIVSDLNCQGLEEYKIAQLKNELLGAKVVMTTYDSSIKVAFTDNMSNKTELIYDRSSQDKNIYIAKELLPNGNIVYTLTLSIMINYISSATLQAKRLNDDSHRIITYTLKRD